MSSQQITSKEIPIIKKAEPGTSIPENYSRTPSGTIYSSTPGGTRIIYDRNTLLNLANSPLAKTPPTKLPYIPVDSNQSGNISSGGESGDEDSSNHNTQGYKDDHDHGVFDIDME
ncbi:8238_t:CDS:2 [Entrophospora sp. SA101]|nr:8238_t:CDS:2 [Entrophospora sp. SA101]CAJ0866626.1 19476_t:CDS:2 [Entrophospora sp. SA101]CAJ0910240.1 3368_t:CDS:2 [Entrophospora sp. SA101]